VEQAVASWTPVGHSGRKADVVVIVVMLLKQQLLER